jgi:excisionase family DNA binding protein
MSTTTSVDRLLTAGDVATLLGVQPRVVRMWANNGRIPYIRVSRKILRFDPIDIESWLASHRVAGSEISPA